MCTGGAGGDLRRVLRDVVAALEVGSWRSVLRPPEFAGCVMAGPKPLVRWAIALRLVARSMQLQAQGRVHDAWDRLGEAAGLLPPQLRRRTASADTVEAVLRPPPQRGESADVELVLRVARLIWREQFELRDLRQRFAGGKMKPRDELVEAYIQYLSWVDFDPSTFYRSSASESLWDDGTQLDRSRAVICLFGTEIRWFANPMQKIRLSQAPWQDINGLRGLAAEALDRLADRPVPAPWCGVDGTSGLVVRRGRLRAWQHARQRRDDLDAFDP